jgi:aminoglycoside 3-N-acetyltransferase I
VHFEIKKLTPDEIKLAKELFLFFQVGDGKYNPTVSSDSYLTELLSKKDFHALVALEKEKILGGLTAYELTKYKSEKSEMFLYEIDVAAEYRRSGVATALIERLKAICAEKNIFEMFVLTEAGNFPARKLYEKTGGKGFETIEFDYHLE